MQQVEQLNSLKRKVDFNNYDITIKELITWVDEKILDIAPEYQRQFRWDGTRQSALIESLFLGIPVPSLYMATNPDGTWELVDGVQRLSSLIRFAADTSVREKFKSLGSTVFSEPLRLENLEKLTSFNGKTFDFFPRSIQLEFLLKPIKITTLSDKSDLDVRFDLFERLNRGGIELTNQEIRSCVFRGKFNDFIQSLSQDDNFLKTVRFNSRQQKDGTKEEYVLRFFAFFYSYKEFDHNVGSFLNDYMKAATTRFEYAAGEKIFKKTFEQLSNLPFGITRGRSTTPTNLFEGVAVGAALALKEVDKLNLQSANDWIASKTLTSYTTGATNSSTMVKGRIEFSRDKFLGK